ncbi:MAG: hypothetical protein KF905_06185 [Flavobacteriales bacterium]|nr:hypothetical protein [Flavobacteriales bacterium]
MSYSKLIPIAILATCLMACGGSSDAPPAADAKKVEAITRITSMEDSLFAVGTLDPRGANALIDVYKAYVTAFPLDTMAPEYLFRAAGVYNNLRQYDKSILQLDRITTDYPGWTRLVDAYYYKAFVLDEGMDRKGEAKVAYEFVMNNFKEHDFAQQSRMRLETLHMSDEEFLEMAKRKELEEPTSVAR